MREWRFWDWLAYGVLFIGAAILALDTAMHLSPHLAPYIPNSAIWGFAPFVLLLIATAILLTRALGKLGSRSPGTSGPAEGPPVTAPIPAVKTAEADIPLKLAAIDAMREILNTDMPPWILKGHQLTTGGWWNMSMNQQTDQLRTEVTAWRDAEGIINGKIEALRQRNDRFPDIHALFTQAFRAAFIPKYERFVGAMYSLTGDPEIMGDQALRFFVEPIAQDAYEGLRWVEQWRNQTDRKAMELRQSLSR